MRLLLFLVFIFCSTCYLSAATYYLDATNGDNIENNGLSSDTPWKSLYKIREVNSPGDVFLFKRGETWAGEQLYLTASGTSSQLISFGSYGNSADPLPIITSMTATVGADDPLQWTEMMPDVWVLSVIRSPGRLLLNGVEYLRANNKNEVGTTDTEGATSYWYYEAATNLLYLFANQNPALLYSSIAGSKDFYGTLIFNADYLSFSNIDFQGGSGASFAILGGQHIEVSDCSLGYYGGTGALLSESNVSGSRRACSNVNFFDNNVDANFQFMYGPFSERGCGDGIRLRNAASNCVIRDNVFKNWAHNAIELLGDDPAAAGVNNNLIHDNTISAPDIPYAHPLGADGIYGKCQYNEFYNNIASNCRTASQINGNNNWVHHNVMRNMRQSPAKNDATAHGFVLGIYQPGLVCEDNRYDYNLIYDTDEAGFLIRNYGYPIQLTGNSIRNNVVINTGKSPNTTYYSYDVGTSLVIFDNTADGVSGNTIQNNAFYSDESGAEAVYLHYAGSYYNAEDFNNLNGEQGNTISNNLDSDPLLVNVSNSAYLPTESSPLINAAIDVGLAFDMAGNERVYGAAPDIGPLETTVLVPLPVTWGSMSIQLTSEKEVLVLWEIVASTNLRFFVVERSTDARNWEAVGELPAENGARFYHFLDREITTSSYYRIRQLDWDGAFSFSEVQYLNYPFTSEYSLHRLGPNHWQVQNADIQDWSVVKLLIYDATGKPIQSLSGTQNINTNQWASGIYWVQIANNGNRSALTILVD